MNVTVPTGNIFCVAVDGSASSEYAFNLVLNELYKKGDKIYVIHITNNQKSTDLPYDYQPETIFSKYDTKLSGKLLRSQYEVILKDKNQKNEHACVQVNEFAIGKKCSLLLLGFYGHKSRNNKNELTKGINYVINNIKLPVIIVKENSSRNKKETGGLTWMTAIEDNSSKSLKAFQYSVKLIDASKDRVIGVHVSIYDDYWARDVKKSFEEICEKENVGNQLFQIVDKQPGKVVENVLIDLVNFNENEVVDFLVLGHNPSKYGNVNSKFKGFPVLDIIKNSQANILFYC